MACIPIRDIANCCLTMCRIRDPGVRFPGHRQGRKQLWTAGPQDANHHIREYHQFGRMRKRVKSHRHGKASPTRLKLARNGWPPEGLLPRGGFADCRACNSSPAKVSELWAFLLSFLVNFIPTLVNSIKRKKKQREAKANSLFFFMFHIVSAKTGCAPLAT